MIQVINHNINVNEIDDALKWGKWGYNLYILFCFSADADCSFCINQQTNSDQVKKG